MGRVDRAVRDSRVADRIASPSKRLVCSDVGQDVVDVDVDDSIVTGLGHGRRGVFVVRTRFGTGLVVLTGNTTSRDERGGMTPASPSTPSPTTRPRWHRGHGRHLHLATVGAELHLGHAC